MQLNPQARISAFVFSIVLSINFVLYSIQHYLPPSIKNSVSYSILDCPSHSTQNSLSHIIHHIDKSEGEEGTEKRCLCFTCCCVQRSLFTIVKPSINVLIDRYITYLFPFDENPYLIESYTNQLIRSPPILLS